MAEFLSPGHYKSEEKPSIVQIQGVPVGTIALLVETEKGPEQATRVTGWNQFVTRYGGVKSGSYAAETVWAIWRQHPNARIIVQRVLPYENVGDRSTLTALAARVELGDRQANPAVSLEVAAKSVGAWGNGLTVAVEDDGDAFRLVVREGAEIREIFGNLNMDPGSDRYAVRVVNRASEWIVLRDMGSDAAGSERNPVPGTYMLSGGDDGAPITPVHYLGDPVAGTGVYGFDAFNDEGLLLAAPGVTDRMVLEALASYAEERFDSFVVIDPPEGASYDEVIRYAGDLGLSTDFAALYWPRVVMADPFTGVHKVVPPSGLVLGAFARTDAAPGKGPWKVAAGVEDGRLNGVLGLETEDVNRKPIRDLIYPRRVNPILVQPRYGALLYGARTLATSDVQHRHINQRRTFNYVAKSIDLSTEWVQFENNDEALWRRLTRSINGFLARVWRAGGLKGETPALAYAVKIDADNNPPSQVRQGILTGDIGLATQTPAEFVWWRYRKHTLAEELEAAQFGG